MKASIDIWKTSQPVFKIGEMKEYTKTFADDVKVVSQNIVKELIEEGAAEAWWINAGAPQSGLSKSEVVMYYKNNSNSGSFALVGENSVYDEFGTGEEGASDPHPLKDNFGLNSYNSGPTIFFNQFAGRYQWYYRPMAGRPYFTADGATSGIPSGKAMYHGLQRVRAVSDDVTAKNLNEPIKNYINKINKLA